MSDDCISRQAAISDIQEMAEWHTEDAFNADRVIQHLKDLPPVNPQPKTGHWIYELEDWNKWTCSECGWSKRTDVHVKLGYNFCPNCGAKMVESEDKE